MTSPSADDFLSPETAADWLEELGAVSDDATHLTRTFLSPGLTRAKHLVAGWMRSAGLEVFEDRAGNLIGRRCGTVPGAGTLACGSHLDTVRNAGKFDGALGVVAGILATAALHRQGTNLPYDLEIVGFSDEEGVRFQTAYLGSKQYIGRLEGPDLDRTDADRITIRQALADYSPTFPPPPPRGSLLGYIEAHIEQGPVLETANLPLGVVRAIAGQFRARLTIEGCCGHAGTTPMALRRDALAGAAVCISLIEERASASCTGLVATVGELQISSPASNVIPGHVEFTLDIREADANVLAAFRQELFVRMEADMKTRGLSLRIEPALTTNPVACDPSGTDALEKIVLRHQAHCPRLVSGAGHDAVPLADVAPVMMLFVRCRAGLSHHPDEYAQPADIALAAKVLKEFFASFQP